jgi:uncharacterized membrane protein
MSTCTKLMVIYFVLAGFLVPHSYASADINRVIFYTPYARISVPPGESVDYTIDIINKTGEVKDLNIAVTGLPSQWSYTVTAGGWNIKRLSVLPGEKESVKLNITVPLRVKKGRYDFSVWNGVDTSLPLSIYVSEEGTFKTEFDTDQANMEGQASSTFTFKATLRNQTAEKQLFAFRSQAPRGWKVAFKVDYKQVTSAEIEANSTKDITIEVDPPDQAEAGTYKIPVSATAAGTNAKLELEVVITGSYDMEFTTPTGLLSSRITAGNDKRLELVVRNTGSSELKNIKFSSSKPREWEVIFEPENIDVLAPGNSENIHAIIKAPRKAIAGDYVTNLTAKTPEVNKEVAFRISVRTPLLIGWLGVVIILAAIGVVYYLFRKYGRR